ncbi:MAG: hypothetical protein R2874_09030 [Desulfobacterales bacterium]
MQGVCGIKYHRLMQLDLSDAQKTEVANLLAAHRDNSRALADQLQTAKTAFLSWFMEMSPPRKRPSGRHSKTCP